MLNIHEHSLQDVYYMDDFTYLTSYKFTHNPMSFTLLYQEFGKKKEFEKPQPNHLELDQTNI